MRSDVPSGLQARMQTEHCIHSKYTNKKKGGAEQVNKKQHPCMASASAPACRFLPCLSSCPWLPSVINSNLLFSHGVSVRIFETLTRHRNPPDFQHQIESAGTASLKDWATTTFLTSPVWDSHCEPTYRASWSQANKSCLIYTLFCQFCSFREP